MKMDAEKKQVDDMKTLINNCHLSIILILAIIALGITAQPVLADDDIQPTDPSPVEISEESPAEDDARPVEPAPSVTQEPGIPVVETPQDGIPDEAILSDDPQNSDLSESYPQVEEIAHIEPIADHDCPTASTGEDILDASSPAEALDPFYWDGIRYVGFTSGTSTNNCPDWVSICNLGIANPIQQAVDSAPSNTTIFLEAAAYNASVVINTPNLTLRTITVAQKFNLNTYEWEDLWVDSGWSTIASLTLNVPLRNFVRVEANDITVNNGVSIQSAIDLVSEGGSIQVGAGTYQSFIVNKKHITINGVTGDPAIAGAGDLAPVIENELDGILIQNVEGVIIQGMVVRNCEYGIRVVNSADTDINNNTLQNNEVGLFNDDASLNTTARLNIITGNTIGIVSNGQWMKADQNWWGDNSGPNTANGDSTQGLVIIDQWVSDPDNDGVLENDNCPAIYNPSQSDSDGDNKGDACDPSPESASDEMVVPLFQYSILIPVTGRNAVELSCTQTVTQLRLENGDSVSISNGCGYLASLTRLTQTSLPAPLPEGSGQIVSTLEFGLFPTLITAEQVISLSFVIPGEFQNQELFLYVWRADPDAISGQWQILSIASINNQYAIAAITAPGIYALAAR
jgi:parallel beta-helix repeat protein